MKEKKGGCAAPIITFIAVMVISAVIRVLWVENIPDFNLRMELNSKFGTYTWIVAIVLSIIVAVATNSSKHSTPTGSGKNQTPSIQTDWFKAHQYISKLKPLTDFSGLYIRSGSETVYCEMYGNMSIERYYDYWYVAIGFGVPKAFSMAHGIHRIGDIGDYVELARMPESQGYKNIIYNVTEECGGATIRLFDYGFAQLLCLLPINGSVSKKEIQRKLGI